jgi:hypothetical protein
MNRIYAYRSAIVHGSKTTEKKRVIKIDKEEIEVHSLAVRFLRKTLRILIEYPQFREAKKIDENLLLGGKHNGMPS